MSPVTKEQVEAGRAANVRGRRGPDTAPEVPASRTATAPLPDPYADMNGWEKRRAQELEAMKRSGEILNWWGGKHRGITLKLAHDTRYTPDFLVQHIDGSLTLEEVKGFFRDDAKVKTKLCAALYPFPLRVLTAKPQKRGGGWDITEVQP